MQQTLGSYYYLLVGLWCCAPTPTPTKQQPASQEPARVQIAQRAQDSALPLVPKASLMFVCGIDAEEITAPTVVADLRLHSGNTNRLPSDADIQRIESAGGTILHRFNVALVRARLDTSALRMLVSPTGIADYATLVTDPAKYEVSLQIYFSRPVSSEDMDALRRTNVKVSRIPVRPEILYARAEDKAIPAIEKVAGVDFVRARSMVCDSWG